MTVNRIDYGDALNHYRNWLSPVTIISDGAYGVKGFPGDTSTVKKLPAWYEPHFEAWTAAATPQTSLWLWNTDIGWATIHSSLESLGWKYVQHVFWNKGVSHIAGKTNSKTLRTYPVITETSVLYVRPSQPILKPDYEQSMQKWLRGEWVRTGLPFIEANTACQVTGAATRKYLVEDDEWYAPPPKRFMLLQEYANRHGRKTTQPYFSSPPPFITRKAWETLRSKWNYTHGETNVWEYPPLRNTERIKNSSGKYVHANQKPLELMRKQIRATTDEGDVVWEPFGGLCSASIAAYELGRASYAAEIRQDFYDIAASRLKLVQNTPHLF